MADQRLEQIVLLRVMRLNAVVHGIVAGLLIGLGIFIATNWLVVRGGEIVGPHLALLGQFFIGYQVTFVGSLIGFGYGFISGFLIGYFIAAVYNRLADSRENRPRSSAP
jgi:hypothetical protein